MVSKIIPSDIKDLMYQISGDPGPDFLTSSGIQKGLILNHRDKLLCQEGLGFGVPIIRNQLDTFFSKKATVKYLSDRGIEKTFYFDCVSKIKLGTPIFAQVDFFTRIFEIIVTFYMKHESVQPALLKVLQIVTKIFRGSCTFVDIDEIGSATVTYDIEGNLIAIKAAFHTPLERPVFTMANEQGADFFDKARVDGTLFSNGNIRGWMRASEAIYLSTAQRLSFTVEGIKDKTLFLGRECNAFLHWAGINLEGCNPSFDYVVRVESTID